MTPFQSYEEENITYWTRRTPGYSSVNQEELSTQQRGVWSELLSERIQARYPGCRPEDIRVLDVGTGPGSGLSDHRRGLHGVHAGGRAEERGNAGEKDLFQADERRGAGLSGWYL